MTFQITALDPAPFAPLFAMDDAALRARGARRVVADAGPGFPCRVSLAGAEPGETLILVNHRHLEGDTPYAAAHAVFVRQGAIRAMPAPGELPLVLRRRRLSVRAHDGEVLATHLETLFARPDVAFVHLHNARPGCFAAAASRA